MDNLPPAVQLDHTHQWESWDLNLKGKSLVFFFFWSPFVNVQRNMTERMNKKNAL